MMSTITDAHRFLYGRSPLTVDKRIWVCSGQIHDWFYHDLLFGCVNFRRTLALWALEHLPLTVTFTRDGQLDFSNNPDPAAAEALFNGRQVRRRQRYGQSWQPQATPATPPAATPAGDSDATAARAHQAAENVQQAVGGAEQGVINTLQRLTHLIRSPDVPSLIIMDEFGEYLESLELNPQQQAVALRIKEIVRTWTRDIAHHHLLVFLTLNEGALEQVFPKNMFRTVLWQQLDGPRETEIKAALERLARRRNIPVRDSKAVANLLVPEANLRAALGRVIRSIRDGSNAIEISVAALLHLPPVNEAELASVKQDIVGLTGLQDVKLKLDRLESKARELRRRLENGEAPPEETLHLVFSGNAGTGKTTVARLVARFFHALGLLQRNEVTEITAASIMSQYVGETRENMQRCLENARGGVLFIDEAHQFGNKDSSQAREAIEALVPAAWSWRRDLIIILAGYSRRMPDFFNMDEGLQRRFPLPGRMEFHDYSEAELWEILARKLTAQGYQLEAAAQPRMRAVLQQRHRRGGFGNAGGVDNLIAELRENHLNGPEPGSSLITAVALPPMIRRHPEIRQQAEAKLNSLYGLEPVRARIRTLLDRIEYDLQEAEHGRGLESLRLHPGNMRFSGPPGTGKTTVARLMGELLYGVGCIERPTTFCHSRATLIGDVMGKTAHLVVDAVEKARGGVLFIDEAYALIRDERDSYGQEAVDTLVEQITAPENAGTVFILGGYEAQLEQLLATNPGLHSRFSLNIDFPAFAPEDCVALAHQLLTEQAYSWADGVLERLATLARQARTEQGEAFGSARWVEGQVNGALERMKSRVLAAGIGPTDPGRRRVLPDDLPLAAEPYCEAEPLPPSVNP